MPMVMSPSDRIVAMAEGEILNVGTPDHVRNDPQVIEAYLGGGPAAIQRSDTVAAGTATNS